MKQPILTDTHFELFGRITYHYADLETGLKFLCAVLLKVDVGAFMVVSEPYTSVNLRNVVTSLSNAADFEYPDEREKIIRFAGDLKGASKFRNYIAHCQWTRGSRPDSIKPMHINIRSGRAKTFGHDENEPDYTVHDITKIHDNLAGAGQRFRTFLKEYRYEAIIERNMG
jgi:hypothetical protein